MTLLFSTCEFEKVKGFVIADPDLHLAIIRKARADVPVLHVTYKLSELGEISVFLQLMKKRGIKPQVFLINESSPRPEILILFGIIGIPCKELDRSFGENAIGLKVKNDMTIELSTTVATHVEGRALRRFLGKFNRCKEAYVLISERRTESSVEGSITPLQFFEVNKFERRMPEERMY